jgi:hypothetical protein
VLCVLLYETLLRGNAEDLSVLFVKQTTSFGQNTCFMHQFFVPLAVHTIPKKLHTKLRNVGCIVAVHKPEPFGWLLSSHTFANDDLK